MSVAYYKVAQKTIDLLSLQELLHNNAHGAMVSFIGQVRAFNLGKKVTKISYQVTQPLAINLFSQFAKQARQQWSNKADIIIVHREGDLKVGEISIALLVSTAHREEAFLMNRYLIETIKKQAPIWKKEYYVSGESQWVRGHALCQH